MTDQGSKVSDKVGGMLSGTLHNRHKIQVCIPMLIAECDLRIYTAVMASMSPKLWLLQPIKHCCLQVGHTYNSEVLTADNSRNVFR